MSKYHSEFRVRCVRVCRMFRCIAIALCVLTISALADEAAKEYAVCELEGKVTGKLQLEDDGNTLRIRGTIKGIPKGKHGIHVHEFGKTGNMCNDAGGHYNPLNVNHGGPNDKVRHIGDWGNFDATSNPFNLMMTDAVSKLSGKYKIMGRSIVIHEGVDDLGKGGRPDSHINGHSGPRIGCCVIKPGKC